MLHSAIDTVQPHTSTVARTMSMSTGSIVIPVASDSMERAEPDADTLPVDPGLGTDVSKSTLSSRKRRRDPKILPASESSLKKLVSTPPVGLPPASSIMRCSLEHGLRWDSDIPSTEKDMTASATRLPFACLVCDVKRGNQGACQHQTEVGAAFQPPLRTCLDAVLSFIGSVPDHTMFNQAL